MRTIWINLVKKNHFPYKNRVIVTTLLRQNIKLNSFLENSSSFNIFIPRNDINASTQPQLRCYKFSNDLAGRVYNNQRFASSCNLIPTTKEAPQTSRPKRSSSQLQNSNRTREVRSDLGNYSSRNSRKMAHKGDRTDSSQAMLETALSYARQFFTPRKPGRKHMLMRKVAFNPSVDSFYAPEIAIRLIGKIRDLREVETRTLRISFEKIYKRLISTQLFGEYTAEFMETVQRYVREIVESGQLQNTSNRLVDPTLLAISSKEDFLNYINSFWGESNTTRIHSLVKHYCIPSAAIGAQILQELLANLVVELYEKQSCNKDVDYVLLTTQGQEITHISQIYFSTQELLISPLQMANRNYLTYSTLIRERDRAQQVTLRQNIIQHFEQIVPVDRQEVNYHIRPSNHFAVRKHNLQKAAALVDARAKLRGEQRENIKQQEEPATKQLIQHPKPRRINARNSHYTERKRKEKEQYAATITRLREILDPQRTFTVQSKLHDSTAEAFRKLRLFNDKYDITYNHNPENINSMFLINLIENCPLFAERTTEQLEKLLAMLEFVYGRGEDNLSEISYQQFQEIYETAHGVAPPSVIMKFIIAYLNFDQYGELPKAAFFQTLDICLSQAGRPQRVIKQVLWNFLEKLKLVQNDALRRQNLQTWYQPVRVVYLLLISLIFGTEYNSLQDMLADLLMDD